MIRGKFFIIKNNKKGRKNNNIERERTRTKTTGKKKKGKKMSSRRNSFGARSLDIIQEDFNTWFPPNNTDFSRLREKSVEGAMRHTKIRSIAWKLFLGVLPDDQPPETWGKHILKKREEYQQLMKEYKTDPTEDDDDDPLSCMSDPLDDGDNEGGEESSWQKFYAEQELIKEIEKDMQRLYPTGCDEFFEDPTIREYMTNVLFLWSRMHPETSYRQGMHEILAPIVYQLEWDCINVQDGDGGKDNSVTILANRDGIEGDSFWCFERIMQDMEPLFIVKARDFKALARQREKERALGLLAKRGGATRKRSGTEVANEKVAEIENDDSLTPVLKSCNRIHHQYLHKADPQLHKRLVEMNIEPQLYALAWVRLMFGRQFHIEDVMCLWDGIFAAQSNVGGNGSSPSGRTDKIVEIIEYVGVAMVIFVREFLMAQDEMRCLQRLMKFPPVENVMVLVQRGLEIRKQPNKVYAPKKVARQATPSISNTDNSSSSNDNGKRTSFTRNTIKRGTAGIGKTKDNLVSTVKSVAAAMPKVNFQNLFGEMNPEPTNKSNMGQNGFSSRGNGSKGAPALASPEVKGFMKRSKKREKVASSIIEGDDDRMASDKKLPILKLVYFDAKGKGEAIRLALTYCNIPFEDYRFKSRDEFIQMKESGTLMFGQVPALFIDGVILTQSAAILRYVGKLSQIHRPDKCIYPKNPLVASFVDAFMDQQTDMFTGWSVYKYHERFGVEKDSFTENGLSDLKSNLNRNIFPKHLQFLENRLKINNKKNLWLSGTELPSICDFYWLPKLVDLKTGSTGDITLLNNFPAILEYINRLNRLPEIFEYYNGSTDKTVVENSSNDDPLSNIDGGDSI